MSYDFISLATEGVQEEVTVWQNRPLESLYPLVMFDALRVKIRDGGSVQHKAVHLALGIRADGLNAQGDLYHQRPRKPEYATAQNHQKPGALSRR